METSDVAAALALVISVITFYWTSLRGARITSPAPRIVAFLRNLDDGGYFMGTTLFLTNSGARPAEVNYLYARIRHSDAEVSFNCLAEVPFRQAMSTDFSINQETCPHAFSLPPQTAITKDLLFEARGNANLPEGEFIVEFLADLVTRPRGREILLAKRKVNVIGTLQPGEWVEGIALRKSDVAEMRTQCVSDG